MSSTTAKRLAKDAALVNSSPNPNIKIDINESNLATWQCTLTGPAGTPYKGAKFSFNIEFPDTYPFKPPIITFKTRIYHPNIDSEGAICMSIVKNEEWKPSIKITAVLEDLVRLFQEPNPDDPLVTSVAEVFKTDKKKFEKNVKEYVKKYAS
ncbi:Ubiquitin-conjugating enzyme E2 14 [Neolecta irregularis DAH-3]|uniref:E2 ubiquitin-conjugating enzyme n=1 Tax=Neolecta irregularis (strain DAH-3) TaxID=1198029 RepID=A0A1U7LQK6_NEOID|nr:Ubiquitin-conjugating enzyme E2 14 [Neolecta irregularis DAH-3]|eukprot:OLL24956.1 Ubiquitin-conjugating enzyme E2 14 [Neolecta irregularis DAH-3]